MPRFIAVVLSLLLLAGCLAKHAPVQAPGHLAVSVAGCMAVLDSTEVQAVPATLDEAMYALFGERNLLAKPVAADRFLTLFATRRTTPHRLATMADVATDTDLLFLVETTVAFYSQMNGRYRWTVDVVATISPRGDLTEAFSAHFQVPVFLDHAHEQEDEALTAASPLIERRLGALLDAYLGGL